MFPEEQEINSAVIVTNCNTWYPCQHRALLVVEDGLRVVYHCTPKKVNGHGGNIIREALDVFTADRDVRRFIPVDIDPATVRAYVDVMKYQRWNMLTYNCEDFISEVLTGMKGSTLRGVYLLAIGWLVVPRLTRGKCRC